MYTVTETKQVYELKQGTKTSYKLIDEETQIVTNEQHERITEPETLKYFRRLGGSETAQKGYTIGGYKVTKLTSKNADKTIKIVRTYKFTKN